jgi:Septum formation/Domain of unknown function (DUF4190)
MNAFAIVAFVLGVLGSGCLLGLVFGVIALVQAKARGQRGRGLAIAGIVLSILWVAGGVALVALSVDVARDTVAEANDVKVGDCVQDAPDVDRAVIDLTVVPCAQPHQAEVVQVIMVPDSDFPGEAALARRAQDECPRALADYSPSAARDQSVRLLYTYPRQATWVLGDRQITCLAVHAGAPVTGSIRGTG